MKLKWVKGYKNEVGAVYDENGVLVGFIGLARVLIAIDMLTYSASWESLMDQYVALLGSKQREIAGVANTIESAMDKIIHRRRKII